MRIRWSLSPESIGRGYIQDLRPYRVDDPEESHIKSAQEIKAIRTKKAWILEPLSPDAYAAGVTMLNHKMLPARNLR